MQTPGKIKKEDAKDTADAKCSHAVSGGLPCGRPLFDDKACIFHSRDIEKKKNTFNNAFKEELERQKNNDAPFDFTGIVFPTAVSFKGFVFEKSVSFSAAHFNGNVNFIGSEFSVNADFRDAVFHDKAGFSVAKFIGKADFRNTTFHKQANFMMTTFSEAYFREAVFTDAHFGESVFDRVYFEGVHFSGDVSFAEANINQAYFMDSAFADITLVNMHDTYFNDVYGLLEILDAEKKKRGVPSETKTEFLSKNIRIILGEKSTARYPMISRQIKDDYFLLKFQERHKKIHFIWWLLADCGRSFMRWALWSFIIAAFFAIIYTVTHHFDPNAFKADFISKEMTGVSFLYYSIVTFTTLGYGDIVPMTWQVQILVMVEVILGYLMLGGLISIFANKLARRS